MWPFSLATATSARRRASHRPRLEALEDRYLPSTAGYLDPTFGAPNGYVVTNPGPSAAQTVAVQPDGKIVLAGYIDSRQGGLFVARYNANGTLDGTFGSGGLVITSVGKYGGYANGVAVQADGKIVVSGVAQGPAISSPGPTPYDNAFLVARYNANGTLDKTFGPGNKPTGIVTINIGPRDDQGSRVVLQSWDGKIVVAGYSTRSDSWTYDVAVVRLNTNGTLDGTFGSGGIVTTDVSGSDDVGTGLALQPDHQIVVCGDSRLQTGPNSAIHRFLLLRYNGSNGALDPSFNGTGIVAVAPSTGPGGVSLAGPQAAAHALALQPDGSIVAGGSISDPGAGLPQQGLFARVSGTGALDPTFGSGGFSFVVGLSDAKAIALDSNAAGEFDVAGDLGSGANVSAAVARIQANGSLDPAFGTSGGLTYLTVPGNSENHFHDLALQGDGKIVAAGLTVPPTVDGVILVARYYGTTTAAPAPPPVSPAGGVLGTATATQSTGDGTSTPAQGRTVGFTPSAVEGAAGQADATPFLGPALLAAGEDDSFWAAHSVGRGARSTDVRGWILLDLADNSAW
jgi:uncharacterized delta-60 repeat protein